MNKAVIVDAAREVALIVSATVKIDSHVIHISQREETMLETLAKCPPWLSGVISGLVFLGVYAFLNHVFLGADSLNGGEFAGAGIFGLLAYRMAVRRSSTGHP